MRKNKQGMSVGVVSLITIFVVFLLASLAVLSLSTASANTRLANKALEQQTGYYAADAKAQETLAQIDGVLQRSGADVQALEALEKGITCDPADGVIRFETKINDTAVLKSALQAEGNGYTILSWQAVSGKDWQTDEQIKDLWKGVSE